MFYLVSVASAEVLLSVSATAIIIIFCTQKSRRCPPAAAEKKCCGCCFVLCWCWLCDSFAVCVRFSCLRQIYVLRFTDSESWIFVMNIAKHIGLIASRSDREEEVRVNRVYYC